MRLTVRRGAPRPRGATPRRLLGLLALLAPLLAAGCAVETVRGAQTPAYRQLEQPIRKVAVAPFHVAERTALRAEPGDQPATQAALVARHFSEALRQRGVDVVAPSDLGRALGVEAPGTDALLPGTVVDVATREFGVDAVVMGELTRFVERRGQAAGATRPASVGFRVTLYGAPRGERLWTGAFDETQQAFSENVLSTSRYPGGGLRWLTAEELARWGAKETAAALPLGW
ncbi:MAG: hypothetical protein R3263_06415 [Myxococcota bacterium]|nr:hypothetical protein [Myxococcota bacterium]